MTTTARPGEERTVLRHVSWDTYERLLEDHESSSAPRFTYDRGVLEIMSPLTLHENYSHFIDLLLALWAEETGIRVRGTGSTTFKRAESQRGFEPDASFFIAHENAVRGKYRIDLAVDPAPDLVVEIGISHGSLDKLPLYAEAGVPEVWRFQGGRIEILVLEGSGYRSVAESAAVPGAKAASLSKVLRGVPDQDMGTWVRRARAWVQALTVDR